MKFCGEVLWNQFIQKLKQCVNLLKCGSMYLDIVKIAIEHPPPPLGGPFFREKFVFLNVAMSKHNDEKIQNRSSIS